MKTSQIAWIVGLAGSIATALIGQAELFGEPWRHIITVIAVCFTAVSGYMVQRPSPWDGSERREAGHRAANIRIKPPREFLEE